VGTDEQKLEAFKQTLYQIKHRLEILVSLPVSNLSPQSLEKTVRDLAQT